MQRKHLIESNMKFFMPNLEKYMSIYYNIDYDNVFKNNTYIKWGNKLLLTELNKEMC